MSAESENGAKIKAAKNGMTVESILRLPQKAATDAQMSYARSLGVSIPNSPTLEQMSDLISRAVEPKASDWLVKRAESLGADFDRSRYLGLGYISRQLSEVLAPGSRSALLELAFWYLQSVLRHRLKTKWSHPGESGIEDGRFASIVEVFASDEKVLKSLRKEYSDPVYDYVEFGDGWGGTKSVRTTAYLAATELLSREGPC